MQFETIITEAEGTIGRLTLNRPECLNAMNTTMLAEIAAAARWFDQQRELRVVIVSGAGRAFCAGADLTEPRTKDVLPESQHSWIHRRESAQLGRRMADAIEQMRATTVARLQGHIVGGGVVLVSACDLRIASEDAIFSIPEVELGISLGWGGIPRLVRDIGPVMTKELVMTCRNFSSNEAKALGFVNRVVAADQLDSEVEQLAVAVASMPSVPVAITKEHVNAVVRGMGVGSTTFADGDALLSALAEAESLQARKDYSTRVQKRREQKKQDK